MPNTKKKYPINYDFGKNWDTQIKPLLDNPIVLKALTKGVNDYLSTYPTKTKYKKNTCPASYSSMDWYVTLMDRKEEILLEELRKDNKLPKKFLLIEEKYNKPLDDDDSDYDNQDTFQEYLDMKQKVLKPYLCWNKIKYDMESYVVRMACHQYAPTFELTLARLAEPNEKWRVLAGGDHSTVINSDNTKVFDLLYWCLDSRLENRMFGDPIPKKHIDPTHGGKTAFIGAMTPLYE